MRTRGLRSSGFSLLEVIVALTILTASLTVLFRGFSDSLRVVDRVEANRRRLELVRAKLAELEVLTALRVSDRAEGLFDDGSRWEVELTPFIRPTETRADALVRVTLTVEWDGANERQRRSIVTYRHILVSASEQARSLEEQLRGLR